MLLRRYYNHDTLTFICNLPYIYRNTFNGIPYLFHGPYKCPYHSIWYFSGYSENVLIAILLLKVNCNAKKILLIWKLIGYREP